jgi:SNF2 family DNA or RNA helicase
LFHSLAAPQDYAEQLRGRTRKHTPSRDDYPTVTNHDVVFEMSPLYYHRYMLIEQEANTKGAGEKKKKKRKGVHSDSLATLKKQCIQPEDGGALASLIGGYTITPSPVVAPTKKPRAQFLNDRFGEVDSAVFFSALRRSTNLEKLDQEESATIGSPKVEWIKQFVLDHVGQQTVIFSQFIEAGNQQLCEFLDFAGIKYSYLNGGTSRKVRDTIVEQYNSGAIKILLGSKSAFEGLHLKNTRHHIMIEPSWNHSTRAQADGRTDRYRSHSELPEAERTVDRYYLLLDKPAYAKSDKMPSIDLYLSRLMQTKKDVADELNKCLVEVGI